MKNLTAIRGSEPCLSALLAAGAEIESPDCSGFTPAVCAAVNDREGCLRILIGNGADLAKASANGKTALDVAQSFGKARCEGLIVSAILAADERRHISEVAEEVPKPSTRRLSRSL